MPIYRAPIEDLRFLLRDVVSYEERVATLPALGDATLDVVLAILESAGGFVTDLVLPLNLPGDVQGCRRDTSSVRTPDGYREVYAAYCAGGWPALAGDPAYGGQGLPVSLGLMVRELVAAGSMAFGMYAGLSQGAYRALHAHGNEALRRTFLPHLVDGSWTGTMCMTEPECGSDLSRLRTRAVPSADGSYRITGSKIFISGGDHDLAVNIVHLVLARLPDAPSGTRGISLFVVPKRPTNLETGTIEEGALNGVSCSAIEHKMGIRGSASATLDFDAAQGWLVGQPNGGLAAMFTMMNSSRVGVAVQSVGVAEISYQNARAYASERRQGRAPRAVPTDDSALGDVIVMHPDVRRNLLTMKALVEGARALYIESAIDLDVRARHPDPAMRSAAESRLALMTPVLKSFVSDCAVDVTDLGVTVWGGHGYIHDNGVEQWLRDARIVPLYEGTNAIQALDLAHRKLGLEGGVTVRAFFDGIDDTLLHSRTDSVVADLCRPLDSALSQLRAATACIDSWRNSDVVAVAAVANDYLRLFGLVAMGAAWLRMAQSASAAEATRGAGKKPEAGAGAGKEVHASADLESSAFHFAKIKTARFYMTHVLADAERIACCIADKGAAIMDVLPEEL